MRRIGVHLHVLLEPLEAADVAGALVVPVEHRVERIEHIVRVLPDPDKTIVAMLRSGSTVRVTVTPRDRFGNYVGPGYGSLVKARLNSGGTLVSEVPVDRDQTGSYVFTINEVPMGVIPEVDITVDGVAVGKPVEPSPAAAAAWRGVVDVGTKSINAGVEWLLSPDWSVEGILGYYRRNPRLWQASIGGKRWFGTSPWRPFVAASAGLYGGDAGGSVGGGVLYEVTPAWGVEGVYNYHTVDGGFSTVQVGVRWGW